MKGSLRDYYQPKIQIYQCDNSLLLDTAQDVSFLLLEHHAITPHRVDDDPSTQRCRDITAAIPQPLAMLPSALRHLPEIPGPNLAGRIWPLHPLGLLWGVYVGEESEAVLLLVCSDQEWKVQKAC